MTDAADERLPDRARGDDRSGGPLAIVPLILWLLIQLTMLALAAARVPLWHRAPQPVERAAVEQMVAAQVIASAVLFPWLMRNLATGACVILLTAPFVQLAAMLAEVEVARAARVWGFVAVWLAALLAWAMALRTTRARLIGIALASVMTVGASLLTYLHVEFAVSPRAFARWVDPVSSAIAQLNAVPAHASHWAFVGVALVAGSVAWWTARRRADVTSYPQE